MYNSHLYIFIYELKGCNIKCEVHLPSLDAFMIHYPYASRKIFAT